MLNYNVKSEKSIEEIGFSLKVNFHGLKIPIIVTVQGFVSFITALNEMQTRSSNENSVRLSVRPSNTWIVTKRKKNLSRFLYHTKEHLA